MTPREPIVECPICFDKFNNEDIETHASTCKLRFETALTSGDDTNITTEYTEESDD